MVSQFICCVSESLRRELLSRLLTDCIKIWYTWSASSVDALEVFSCNLFKVYRDLCHRTYTGIDIYIKGYLGYYYHLQWQISLFSFVRLGWALNLYKNVFRLQNIAAFPTHKQPVVLILILIVLWLVIRKSLYFIVSVQIFIDWIVLISLTSKQEKLSQEYYLSSENQFAFPVMTSELRSLTLSVVIAGHCVACYTQNTIPYSLS